LGSCGWISYPQITAAARSNVLSAKHVQYLSSCDWISYPQNPFIVRKLRYYDDKEFAGMFDEG